MSMKESVAFEFASSTVAMYRGLNVSVYNVDKPEISLTRQDLVELIDVCNHLFNKLL